MPLADSLVRSVNSAEFVSTPDMLTYLAASTGHTTLVAGLVQAARSQVEKDTRRAFLVQTWVYKADSFPRSREYMELPRPPLSVVDSIVYTASTGNSVTWSSTNYEVDTNRTPGVVWTTYDSDWPDTQPTQNAVAVTYQAGYTTAAASVPDQAKQAVRLLVSDWFNHRSIDGPANRENYNSLIHSLRWGDYQ